MSTDVAYREERFGVWRFTCYITLCILEKSFNLSDPQSPHLMKENKNCQVRYGGNRKVPSKNLKMNENKIVF